MEVVKCDNCNKEFKIPKWKVKRGKHHFCNKECYLKQLKEHPEIMGNSGKDSKIITKCEYCKKEYKVLFNH